MDFITAKHSFNSGDCITILPGLKHLYKETGKKVRLYQRLDLPADYGHNDAHPIKDANGRMVCMNRSMFDMMKPLIEAQEYIESFQIWEGQPVLFDYDLTRQNSQMPLPGGSIHKWPSLIFPQLECDVNNEWLHVPIPENTKQSIFIKVNGVKMLTLVDDFIIINRTSRYNNPYISYFFLKEHQDNILFTGTESECHKFNNDFNLNLPYLLIDDFYKLAIAIKRCRFFIGVQSLCWHLSDAMKVPRILEVCVQYPNTFPTSSNGYSFISQGALEFFFNKLLKETNVKSTGTF